MDSNFEEGLSIQDVADYIDRNGLEWSIMVGMDLESIQDTRLYEKCKQVYALITEIIEIVEPLYDMIYPDDDIDWGNEEESNNLK